MPQKILRFTEFLKESIDSLKEYNIDENYPWSEEIGNLIDNVIKKVDYLKSEYDYNKHKDSNGFEFNIKIRNWPDIDKLAKKYNVPNAEIYSLCDYYMNDSLQMAGDDIIETSGYFEDWFQTGRSGGWLVLKHKSYLINDTEEAINIAVSNLNYYTYRVNDDIKNKWDELRTVGGSGFKLLHRNNLLDDEEFEDIIEAEKESQETKKKLESYLTSLDELEKELKAIDERISNFWKNVDTNFEEEVKHAINQEE